MSTYYGYQGETPPDYSNDGWTPERSVPRGWRHPRQYQPHSIVKEHKMCEKSAPANNSRFFVIGANTKIDGSGLARTPLGQYSEAVEHAAKLISGQTNPRELLVVQVVAVVRPKSNVEVISYGEWLDQKGRS